MSLFFGRKRLAESLYGNESCACRYFCGILARSLIESACGNGLSEFDDSEAPLRTAIVGIRSRLASASGRLQHTRPIGSGSMFSLY